MALNYAVAVRGFVPLITSLSLFLQAGLPVAGVMGTSAGALAGSLYAAGYTPRQVSISRFRIAVASCMLLKVLASYYLG